MPAYAVPLARRPLAATVRPPGSKSLTNRAFVCAALAAGSSHLQGILESEDTRVMADAWQRLGISLQLDWPNGMAVVRGCGGRLPEATNPAPLSIDVANSGTTMRFLAAVLSALRVRATLVGTPRMHQRPVGALVAALQQLGGRISTVGDTGTPPVAIESASLRGGHVAIDASASSQFVSALLLAAPLALSPIDIEIVGRRVSQPYIAMTRRVMQSFGVEVSMTEDQTRFRIEPQIYQAARYEIEPDATAASYFFAAAAIAGGSVTVAGLSHNSLQGDVRFVDCLRQMGCLVNMGERAITVIGPARHGIDCDLSDISDTAQTLAAVALFADSPTTIRGIAHNRLKETDRIGNLVTELKKLGATVKEREDGLTIIPGALRGATLETYQDHRMAMSLALVGLRVPNVVIANPACVVKTYPHFFEDLARCVN